MNKGKFAFLLMGPKYDKQKHNACFETENKDTYIIAVNNFEEACETVKQLVEDGFGALELCGAFGEEKTRKLIEISAGKIAIGYVTHFTSEDEKFIEFFGRK
jgi:hypothetical protein